MNLFPKWLEKYLGRQLSLNLRAPQMAPLSTPENWHEDFIVHLASILRPKTYVELGLYHSEVFNRIIPFAQNLYGVDMEPVCEPFMKKIPGKTNFFLGSTDAFLQVVKEKHLAIDLLFIDANHSKESVLADFTNYFPFVADQGVILLHDAYPKNNEYTDPGYCGDGYKSIAELSRHTDAYEMVTIPHHPGVAICRKRSKHLPWL